MPGDRIRQALGIAMAATFWPAIAMAQTDPGAELMALGTDDLRSEIGKRYDAALELTRDQTVVAADSNRFMWASQAKAQCGIALGFLKSGTRDAVSIGKCADAYNRMQVQVAVQVPPPVVMRPDVCNAPIAGIVFFDFDSAVPPESSLAIIDSVVSAQRQCNWRMLVVTGHTDRSGSDAYNDALSVRRANAIGAILEGRGLPRSVLNVSGRGESEPKVPTLDGERNPSNRRVEISVQ